LEPHSLRFVAVGHLTNDLLSGGIFAGGSALYSSLTAASLGAAVRIVTSIGPDFIGRKLIAQAGIALEVTPSEQTTRFEAVEVEGARHWRLLARAKELAWASSQAEVLFGCPVIGEIGGPPAAVPAGVLVGAGLQGWLRRVTSDRMVRPQFLSDVSFLRGCRIAFCSEEDLGEREDDLLPALRRIVPMVVVTRGAEGASVYVEHRLLRVKAFPAEAVDPTGAGDVFASCFLIALAQGESVPEAAILATCAASVIVEAPGPTAIPSVAEIRKRAAWYRAHFSSPIEESKG
jgi:1D-myo-inositol 3-kinase